MTDSELKSALQTSYRVESLEDVPRERVRRLARQSPKHRRRTRWLPAIGLAAIAVLAVGCAYPVLSANYLCMSIARQIDRSHPMTVSVWIRGRKVADVALADGVMSMETRPGDITLWRDGRLTQYFAIEKRAIQSRTTSDMESWIRLPDKAISDLSRFELRRRIRRIGSIGGGLDRVALTSDEGNMDLTIDTDTRTGLVAKMETRFARQPIPPVTFQYDHDADAAVRRTEDRLRTLRNAPQIYKPPTGESVAKRYEQMGVIVMSRDRETLFVHSVESNPQGDVFVLYSLIGKTVTPETAGRYLKLRDAEGTEWLSDVITFPFGEIEFNGVAAKAQVFFHPRGKNVSGPVSLSAAYALNKNRDGNVTPRFVPTDMPGVQRIDDPLTKTTPVAVPFLRPDWVLYAFNIDEPRWLSADAAKLRFRNALSNGDWRYAEQVGRRLASDFPETTIFFTRKELYAGLAKAYRATGDAGLAQDYDRKSRDQVDP